MNCQYINKVLVIVHATLFAAMIQLFKHMYLQLIYEVYYCLERIVYFFITLMMIFANLFEHLVEMLYKNIGKFR